MPESSTLPDKRRPPSRSLRRRWLFRVVAVLLGLSPLLVSETVLRLIDWQPPGAVIDPYVGFNSVRPLFELGDDRTHWQIAANRKPLFRDDSFVADKPEAGLRVFCVGGSTVQGRPFGIETAFSTWLEINLQLLQPDREVEVINCGGVSYASYRLVPIVEEILQHEPDLIVLYTGHNEFLEDRTYQSVRDTPGWAINLHSWLASLKTYSWLRSLFVGRSSSTLESDADHSRYQLPTEVEARLDYQGGLALYQRDDAWRENVVRHFGINLARMIRMTRESNVPLILMNPVSNLRDCAPFKSQFSQTTNEPDRSVIEQALARLDRDSPPTQLELSQDLQQLSVAVKLDPRYAATHFALGQTIIQLSAPTASQLKLARESFVQAKEEDVCPLRMLESMHEMLISTAARERVPMIDVRDYFRRRSDGGVVGAESLVDHVHPGISGHQRIAELIVEHLAEHSSRFTSLGLEEFSDRLDSSVFPERRGELYGSHLATLPNLYFELGKDQLEGLRRWAAGEVRKQRDPEE